MTITTVSNSSVDANRMFAIEVKSGSHQTIQRSSTYTLKVAYSSLAKTIQSIGKRGGKVVNVTMLNHSFSHVEPVAAVSPAVTPVVEVETVPKTIESPPKPPKVEQAAPDSRRKQSKSKRR
jgi:CpcD/allophycocyanin linker domain